jgi:hypothetical protein
VVLADALDADSIVVPSRKVPTPPTDRTTESRRLIGA